MSTSTTQLFEGPTIEEALGAAVAEMGNDLEIIDAHKVRKRRRFSVRSDERFEVIAASRTVGEEEFEDVLRRMVDTVDEQERTVALDLRNGEPDTVDLRNGEPDTVDLRNGDVVSTPARWEGPDFVVQLAPAATDAHDNEIIPPRPGADSDTPVPAPVAVADAAPTACATPVAPSTGPARAPGAVPVAPSAGGVWSDDALAMLGVPALVREQVTRRAPVQDLEWVGALADAIAEIAAGFDTGGSYVELTGHGRESAVDLIVGMCRGMRVGDMVVDGVRIPATPVELALAVRARLQG